MSDPAHASLNWKEIDLLLEELDLQGCLIQEIHQPSREAFVLGLYRPGGPLALLVSLSPRFPRVHSLSRRMPASGRPPRFASFLRAHLRGGRIMSAGQVAGERIVRIDVHRAGEERILWLRLWTSAANAIVTDGEGAILDAMYRRPAKGEVSGGTFDPARAAPRAADRPRRDYAVRDLPGEGSFNERVEAHYARLEEEGRRGQLAEHAEAALAARENGVLATLKQLEARRASYAEPGRLRELGDLITSNLHKAGRGERLLEVEDFFRGGAKLIIEMDPALSPAQNAEKYYQRAHKAKQGLGKVLSEIESLQGLLAGIRVQREALAAAPDTQALAGIAGRAAPARTPRVDPGTPGLVFWSGPFKCLVGRTGAENDELLRRWVRGSDWWFHARDWPGAYVFVKTPQGKSLPLETMLDAGNLAIHFSRGKASAGGEVYYTRVKYLRRAKGAKRGTVLPTQEKNLSIRLEPGRVERLKLAGAAP